MNKNKNFRSISSKLVFMLSFSAFIAIAMTSIVLFWYKYNQNKEQIIETLSQTVSIMGENLVASLEFDDAESAKSILLALKANEDIDGAYIFKEDKTLFSSYVRDGVDDTTIQSKIVIVSATNELKNELKQIDMKSVIVNKPIYKNDKYLASFLIVSNTHNFTHVLMMQFYIQVATLIFVLLLVTLLAFRLQRTFTFPIFTVMDAMKEVREHSNYDVKMYIRTNDEFQSLFDGFDAMIETIKEQNQKLEHHTKILNDTIEEKTKDINKKNRELEISLKRMNQNVIFSETDLHGNITHASEAFCAISGYSLEELIGQPHKIVRHPDMDQSVFKEMWKSLKNNACWFGEVKNLRKDGTFYWVFSRVEPSIDSDGRHVGYYAIRQDITAKKAFESLSVQQAIQMAEIERSNRLLNGRENRMVELKQEMNEYRMKLGEEAKYSIIDVENLDIEEDIIFNNEEVDLKVLLDVEQLQKLMEHFYTMMHIPLAIIDLKGDVLVQSKWQRSCTDFHRANAESCKRCIESDIDLASKLGEGEKFTSYKCKNGLIDCASPIIINGKHEANFFIGQFLINEPDMEYFKNQAKLFGYDEDDYLNSIRDVPIVKEDMLQNILGFLLEITNVVTTISIEKLRAQKNEKITAIRTQEMQKGQIAAMNLAEDAEKARLEIENYKEHLESLVEERTEDLLASQEKLSFALRAANMGTWEYDIKGNSLMADENGKRLYGLDNIPLDGTLEQWFTFIHPDDIAPLAETMQDTIQNHKIDYTSTFRVVTPQTNEIHHIMSLGKFLYGKNQEPLSASGLVWDITDMKVAQEKLELLSQLVYGSLKSASVGAWWVDFTEEDTFHALQNTSEMIGIDFKSDDDTLVISEWGKVLQDTAALNEEYKKAVDDTFENFTGAISGKYESYLATYPILYANGEVRWITARADVPKRDADGKALLMTGTLIDVTDFKMAQEQINEQKEFIQTVVDSQEQMIVTTNGVTIISANREFLDFYSVNSIEEFQKKYNTNCICGTFNTNAPDGYLQIEMDNEKWIDYVIARSHSDITHKAMITRDNVNYIFSVTAATLPGNKGLKSAVFTNITAIEAAKQEIEAIHKHTRESIEYAALIQGALIPDNQIFKNFFQDYFAIWHPKDIVGGDIYLMNELNENEVVIMVIDCTGHGVPGAFVTMLVKAIERQIMSNIYKDEIISPAKILTIFNRSIKHLLKQESIDSVSNAGFDGGIIYYNKKEKIVRYAGAQTALFYMDENNILQTIKGSRHSIGYKKSDANFEFKEHTIAVKEGMQFYCTTDGYLDQNGGEKGFPFGKKKFCDIIEEYYQESMAEQQEVFLYKMAEYENMIANNDRNDDMTVVGFKI